MKVMKKSSSVRLRQPKITAFWSAAGNSTNRKRKNAVDVSEVHKTPVKKAARLDSKSPDMFLTPPEWHQEIAEVEAFAFEDFENDPFISPRKKESPKKNILRENHSSNETWTGDKSEISFDVSLKCRVTNSTFLTGEHFEQVLLLTEESSNKRGICRLREVWTSFAFSADDVVCVRAVADSQGRWIVDNANGHVILYPDVVVSTTTLTKSMFCLRQGILSDYFKEIDSEGVNRMLIGRLIHELFQESLRTGARSGEDLHRIAVNFLRSRSNLHNIYFSGMTVSDVQKEMRNFIPRVRNFVQVYVDKQAAPAGGNFEGSIDDIADIEELIKSPTLGLQGRVDVTVKMTSKRGGDRIAPLELKTGRASFSSEHRSQLVTYILLMNELGRKVDSGLLLYLREDILEEILPRRDEIRNLFLLRNHFVDFFKRFGGGVLPEPIRNGKACEKCSLFRICATYLREGKDRDGVSDAHPLKRAEVPDVKPSHVDYFLRWSKMLCLEHEEVFQEMTERYEASGLTLEPNAVPLGEEFKCVFRVGKGSGGGGIRPGVKVHVEDSKGERIGAGRVLEAADGQVTVLTDKMPLDFSDAYRLVVFKSKFLSIYLSNLGWFMNEEFKNLRELIVDKRAPRFERNFDETNFREKCLELLLGLNKQQQKAVLKSVLCQDYLLIKGPPGTGKTQTILTLIRVLLALGKTVLVVGHTHSSVDNILLRLEGIEYLRLGSLKSIRKEIHGNSYEFLAETCSSVEDVGKLFERKLIATTCLGIDADFVRKMKLDYCIADESSQALQPEILRPLFCCRKFVLIGDEHQLPPIVRNPEAKNLGMDESIFEWLSRTCEEESIVRLSQQYRMNSVINSLANSITYGGLIKCGNEGVAKATVKIPHREKRSGEEERWTAEILSDELENSVVFVDTSEYFQTGGGKSSEARSSRLEANIIVKLITRLIEFGLKEESVGVITPFWDQIALLKGKLGENDLGGIELNTVEQYQGRDKEVILFSCTKENQADRETVESELLNDGRRLNVAVTRAKHKLIITGDRRTVVRYKPFEKLLSSLSETQIFRLSNGEKDFFWEHFVS